MNDARDGVGWSGGAGGARGSLALRARGSRTHSDGQTSVTGTFRSTPASPLFSHIRTVVAPTFTLFLGAPLLLGCV